MEKPLTIFDPVHPYKRMTLTDFTAKKLQVQIFDKGQCVYESPDIETIKKYCAEQIDTIWEEVRRFENPHEYYVDLSQPLWELKTRLLSEQFNK